MCSLVGFDFGLGLRQGLGFGLGFPSPFLWSVVFEGYRAGFGGDTMGGGGISLGGFPGGGGGGLCGTRA